MNLAYHGGLVNTNAPARSPVLETYLAKSLFQNAAYRAPFSPGDTTNWFNTLYNYASPPSPLPLRPLLVVRNPVSSFVPNYFTDSGFYSAAQAYGFGNRVQFPDPNTGNLRGFVCIQNNTGVLPANVDGTYNNAFWAAMPWASALLRLTPTRAHSVNSGRPIGV